MTTGIPIAGSDIIIAARRMNSGCIMAGRIINYANASWGIVAKRLADDYHPKTLAARVQLQRRGMGRGGSTNETLAICHTGGVAPEPPLGGRVRGARPLPAVWCKDYLAIVRRLRRPLACGSIASWENDVTGD
jgi:hypothetical protein